MYHHKNMRLCSTSLMIAVMVNLSYQNTRNSISSAVTYDPVTGGRTSQPQNINGNWSTSAGFMFNTALDTLGRFYTNTFTDFSYSNRVGFLNLNNSVEPDKNTVKTTGVRETLKAGTVVCRLLARAHGEQFR